MLYVFFFFQAEDGIRDLVRSRGLGDVYKRQGECDRRREAADDRDNVPFQPEPLQRLLNWPLFKPCLLYTSDAADERSSVDLGGRRIIKKRNHKKKRATQENRKQAVR